LEKVPSEKRRIDVWWWDDASSHLMLLLAYLATRNKDWQAAKIRVLAPSVDHPTEESMADFKGRLEDARIEAEPEIVFNAKMSNVIAYSKDASLVFLPFRLKGDQPLDPFGNPVEQILSGLPITALALASEDIELEAEPEEGKAGEIASALDTRADTEKQALKAEKEAEEAKKVAFSAREKLLQAKTKALESAGDESLVSELEAEVKNAEKQAEKAARRAAKVRTKMEIAARAVENLGIPPLKPEKETDEEGDPEKK
jgi:hypothetical protein